MFNDFLYFTYRLNLKCHLSRQKSRHLKRKLTLESLPIFPDRYDFEVAKDKGKQFKIVAELLKKANTIIVATDSDREGENSATCF